MTLSWSACQRGSPEGGLRHHELYGDRSDKYLIPFGAIERLNKLLTESFIPSLRTQVIIPIDKFSETA